MSAELIYPLFLLGHCKRLQLINRDGQDGDPGKDRI
jgi:hypothetical protein